MRILENIEPKNVFKFFEDICSIPHGSGNTKKISDYLVSFAKEKGLEYYQDKLDNVIIIKEASQGYENSEALIMQAHIDMVCEKEPGNLKDMSKEPIELVVNDDLISAKGTTLGADDGIGASYILAVLNDNSLVHPKIEAVFTVDEEIGMLGAFDIDVSKLTGKRMLNLDGGDEKIFTVSCAGGITLKSTFCLNREEYTGNALKIKISGLSGGHSGVMIGEGGANSNSLSGRLLSMLFKDTDIRLCNIEGGFKDNAIPVETIITVVTSNTAECADIILKAQDIFKNEYSVTDPGLYISYSECEYSVPFDYESTKNVIYLLNIAPNGVQKMSSHIKDLVETSLNFAILKCNDNYLEATFSVRSSTDSQKYMVIDILKNLTECLDGTTEISGDYPGWEFKAESEFRNLVTKVYVDKFGFEPETEAVHAGLECGLFSGMIEGLDALSYGPNMWDIHTPAERLSISSTARAWEFIKELLKNLK